MIKEKRRRQPDQPESSTIGASMMEHNLTIHGGGLHETDESHIIQTCREVGIVDKLATIVQNDSLEVAKIREVIQTSYYARSLATHMQFSLLTGTLVDSGLYGIKYAMHSVNHILHQFHSFRSPYLLLRPSELAIRFRTFPTT